MSPIPLMGALLAGALLAACGGGGRSSSSALPGAGAGSGNTPVTTQSGTQLVVKIDRSRVRRAKGKRRGAGTTRSPKYFSLSVAGLQVAVSTTGSNPTTKTIYADVSTTSPLCTPDGSGGVQTCSIAIPTLASSEKIVATEVDQSPTNETAGYGTGFPTGTNIAAVGMTTTNLTLGGPVTVTLGLAPVAGAAFYDCTGAVTNPAGTTSTSSNFGIDGGQSSTPARIVVTGGVASQGVIEPEFGDAAGSYPIVDPTPNLLVDVNGSPTPITITGSQAGITLAALPNTATTPPPPSAYATTVSIPDDSYQWADCFFVIPVKMSATLAGTSGSIFLNNNLTALNPFLSPPAAYPQTFTYPVAILTVSGVTGSPAVTGGISGSVTGTDFMAGSGMDTESAYNVGDEQCNSSGGVQLASVVQSGPINTTTWQQGFTIIPMTAGTCTFVLYDVNTGVVTLPVTVTIGS